MGGPVPGERRNKLPLIAAAVVGILLILFVRSRSNDDGPSGGGKTSGPCVSVAVAASSEKAALLKEIAAAYHKDEPRVAGRCVEIVVNSKSSGGAAEALARGWDERLDGPRPDVWSPASSSWVVILRQRLTVRDATNIVPDSYERVATTPLVMAMPRPMAEALGWPSKKIGWSTMLDLARDPNGWGRVGHSEWGAFRLGKTNPNFSTSGLNATIAAYFAATGRSSDLTKKDVADPKVKRFVHGVESSVVHYGDITLTFLENLQRADDSGQALSYISAVTVEEKSVWDYNQGNPTGDPTTLGKHPKPRTPLVAIYPKEGTLLSDNPYVVLNAAWVDDAKKAAAQSFLKFLQRGEQQARFQRAAFRDFRGVAGDVINLNNGMIREEPRSVISPPAPSVLDAVSRSWVQLRKRARVELVIDVSGSMGEAAGGGDSKLELAKRAAINALDQFSADDEVGLWIFSSDFSANDHKPYLELIPIGKLGSRKALFRSKISSLTPQGGTALYATLRAVTREVRRTFDPTRINAVVLLTDGKNEYPADSDIDSLLDELRVEGDADAVRVFPIAYGEDADLDTLKRIAHEARAAAYDASDPATIDKVFTAVISNF